MRFPVSSIATCAGLLGLDLGRAVAVRSCIIDANIYVASALVDMYGKLWCC
jgi:hypothetical protein